MTLTSYLSRPSIELSRVETAQRGSRLFGKRYQPKQHRVVDVDVDGGIFVVDSTLRFRIDEVVEVGTGGTVVKAVVESIEHNPLTEEQRYVLSVQRTAEDTLTFLEGALADGEAARVERRGPNRPFGGTPSTARPSEEITPVAPATPTLRRSA